MKNKALVVAGAAILIAATYLVASEQTAAPTVEWIGHPMISDNDPYTPSQGWLSTVQIGLRSDGIVVWRNVSKPDPKKFLDFKP